MDGRQGDALAEDVAGVVVEGADEDAADAERTARYAREARAPSTRRTYNGQWNGWVAYCARKGKVPLPAEPRVLATYLAELADGGRKPLGIDVALTAISQAHVRAGYPSPRSHPFVREVRAGIRHVHKARPVQKSPILVEDLDALLALCGDDRVGRRDAAILTLAWAGAFRASELCALDLDDLVPVRDRGLLVMLRSSKTDPEGKGERKAIPHARNPAHCPVRLLERWLELRGRGAGPLFMGSRHGALTAHRLTRRDIARLVKRLCVRVNLDPVEFSSHSLRAGFVTTAVLADRPLPAIAAQTLHRRLETLLVYVRRADLFKGNAVEGLL
jgi:integrase